MFFFGLPGIHGFGIFFHLTSKACNLTNFSIWEKSQICRIIYGTRSLDLCYFRTKKWKSYTRKIELDDPRGIKFGHSTELVGNRIWEKNNFNGWPPQSFLNPHPVWFVSELRLAVVDDFRMIWNQLSPSLRRSVVSIEDYYFTND